MLISANFQRMLSQRCHCAERRRTTRAGQGRTPQSPFRLPRRSDSSAGPRPTYPDRSQAVSLGNGSCFGSKFLRAQAGRAASPSSAAPVFQNSASLPYLSVRNPRAAVPGASTLSPRGAFPTLPVITAYRQSAIVGPSPPAAPACLAAVGAAGSRAPGRSLAVPERGGLPAAQRDALSAPAERRFQSALTERRRLPAPAGPRRRPRTRCPHGAAGCPLSQGGVRPAPAALGAAPPPAAAGPARRIPPSPWLFPAAAAAPAPPRCSPRAPPPAAGCSPPSPPPPAAELRTQDGRRVSFGLRRRPAFASRFPSLAGLGK